MKVRFVLDNGTQVVREANYWQSHRDAKPWEGEHVATKVDGVWRNYSNQSDTASWPVTGIDEAAAFSGLPTQRSTVR